MSVHIGEVHSQVTVAPAAPAPPADAGAARLPRWSDIELHRAVRAAARRQRERTGTGERHD